METISEEDGLGGNPLSTSLPMAKLPTWNHPSTFPHNADIDEASGTPDPMSHGDGLHARENDEKNPAVSEGTGDNLLASSAESDDEISSEDGLPEMRAPKSFASRQGSRHTASAARFMSTRDMFKAYMVRLGRDKTTGEIPIVSEESDSDERKPKGAAMMRGIMDYIKSLEDRIMNLETAAREGQKYPLVEDGYNMGGTAKPATGSDELLLEVKFFDANYVSPEYDGRCLSSHRAREPYRCASGPKHLIRVLYDWRENVSPRDDVLLGQAPLPDEIDVIGLGIRSDPIMAFFKRRLNVTHHPRTGLVRMSKPFQPLLRNLDALRSHLAVLEKAYKHVDEAGSHTTLTMEHERPITAAAVATGSHQEPNDARSSPPKEGPRPDEQEEYDTREALSHFRLLVEFIDKFLARQVLLLQQLSLGLEDKIAFEDLWMLFDGGVNIYCPFLEGGTGNSPRPRDAWGDDTPQPKARHVPQIYRVVGTTGGLPLKDLLSAKSPIRSKAHATGNGNELSGDFLLGLTAATETRTESNDRTSANLVAELLRDTTRETFAQLNVVVIHIAFDGIEYGLDQEVFRFKPYDGVVDVRTLQVYPMQFATPRPRQFGAETSSENDRYLVRGRKFIDLTALPVSHLSFDGLTTGKDREEISSAVIVDFRLGFQEHSHSFADGEGIVPRISTSRTGPRIWPYSIRSANSGVMQFYGSKCREPWCASPTCLVDGYLSLFVEQEQRIQRVIINQLEEHNQSKLHSGENLDRFKQYMEKNDFVRLLPGTVPAFALRNRKWVMLDLEQLKELKHGDDWGKLVLPHGHKEMVQAMVETHTKGSREPGSGGSSESSDHQGRVSLDLVQGKGKGCIILLHGVPGVGKTSTAGDIGYVPEAVEKNMAEHFKLAHEWGCVLLLDEADVFLAKRTKTDVKRNGLVSVFLRILEYYSGILFLTTNRVGAIDDAFRSRLHLTLYYPKLTRSQTKKIWKNNFQRLAEINETRRHSHQQPIAVDEKRIIRWVEINWETLQWNGRQIRNAFQTAVALAEFDTKMDRASKASVQVEETPKQPVLNVKTFKVIANASMQFSEYLKSTHGDDEDGIAGSEKVRAKTFDSQPAYMRRSRIQASDSSSTSNSSTSSGSGSETETDGSSEGDSATKESSGDGESGDDRKRHGKGKGKGKKGKPSSKGRKFKGVEKDKGSEKSRGKERRNK